MDDERMLVYERTEAILYAASLRERTLSVSRHEFDIGFLNDHLCEFKADEVRYADDGLTPVYMAFSWPDESNATNRHTATYTLIEGERNG